MMSTIREEPTQNVPVSVGQIGDNLPPLRFRLRQLLAFVTLVSLLMAAMVIAGGLLASALLLAALVVTVHLFSTAVGTRLQAHANHPRTVAASQRADDPPAISADLLRDAQAGPRSPWHLRSGTPLPWLARLIAVAFLVGGISGACTLLFVVGYRTSPAGIAVGAISTAVIMGWLAFVGYSFFGVFRHGVRDALAGERRDQSS